MVLSLTGLSGQASAGKQSAAPALLLPPGGMKTDVVRLTTAWSVDSARPGDHFILAVVLDIKKGFHVIADAGQLTPIVDFRPIPTRVTVKSASNYLTIEAARFPRAYPAKVDFIDGDLMSFEGPTIIYLPMRVDSKTSPGRVHVKAEILYQACDNQICLFPKTETRDVFMTIV